MTKRIPTGMQQHFNETIAFIEFGPKVWKKNLDIQKLLRSVCIIVPWSAIDSSGFLNKKLRFMNIQGGTEELLMMSLWGLLTSKSRLCFSIFRLEYRLLMSKNGLQHFFFEFIDFIEEVENNVVRLPKRYIRDKEDPFRFYSNLKFKKRYSLSKITVFERILPLVEEDF